MAASSQAGFFRRFFVDNPVDNAEIFEKTEKVYLHRLMRPAEKMSRPRAASGR